MGSNFKQVIGEELTKETLSKNLKESREQAMMPSGQRSLETEGIAKAEVLM